MTSAAATVLRRPLRFRVFRWVLVCVALSGVFVCAPGAAAGSSNVNIIYGEGTDHPWGPVPPGFAGAWPNRYIYQDSCEIVTLEGPRCFFAPIILVVRVSPVSVNDWVNLVEVDAHPAVGVAVLSIDPPLPAQPAQRGDVEVVIELTPPRIPCNDMLQFFWISVKAVTSPGPADPNDPNFPPPGSRTGTCPGFLLFECNKPSPEPKVASTQSTQVQPAMIPTRAFFAFSVLNADEAPREYALEFSLSEPWPVNDAPPPVIGVLPGESLTFTMSADVPGGLPVGTEATATLSATVLGGGEDGPGGTGFASAVLIIEPLPAEDVPLLGPAGAAVFAGLLVGGGAVVVGRRRLGVSG